MSRNLNELTLAEDQRLGLLFRALALLVAEGLSLGLAVWCLLNRTALFDYAQLNQVDSNARTQCLMSMLGGALCFTAAGVLLSRRRDAGGVELASRLASRLAPL